MVKRDFYIPSSVQGVTLHGTMWAPDGEIRAVLQICHGMIEHIGRYGKLAKYLCARGIAAAGHDFLGHGKTAEEGERGFFAERDGEQRLLDDIGLTAGYIKGFYPEKPFFVMGHSMGSFFVRRYMTLHSSEISGAILLGTGGQRRLVLEAGRAAAEFSATVRGPRHRSRWIHEGMIGRFSRMAGGPGFSAGEEKYSWLSRDPGEARAYGEDPLNQFIFTDGACRDFMRVMVRLAREEDFEKIRKELPILFQSGGSDPVGENGAGVRRAARALGRHGLENVCVKIYPGARHELIHEQNREEVFADMAEWMLEQCERERGR